MFAAQIAEHGRMIDFKAGTGVRLCVCVLVRCVRSCALKSARICVFFSSSVFVHAHMYMSCLWVIFCLCVWIRF